MVYEQRNIVARARGVWEGETEKRELFTTGAPSHWNVDTIPVNKYKMANVSRPTYCGKSTLFKMQSIFQILGFRGIYLPFIIYHCYMNSVDTWYQINHCSMKYCQRIWNVIWSNLIFYIGYTLPIRFPYLMPKVNINFLAQ